MILQKNNIALNAQ